MKTSRFISIISLNSLLLTVVPSVTLQAQTTDGQEQVKPSLYVPVVEEKPKQVFFQGFTLAVDVFNPLQRVLSSYGSMEGALRLNLKNTFFPVVEAGFATCDQKNENTDLQYRVKAPFLRAGIDINMLRNKWQENRLFLGARYGFSTFQYDIDGPDMKDPVWGGSQPFHHHGIHASAHWVEFVAGVQVKIWRNFHMGWSIRLKKAVSEGENNHGIPYYIPGYGTTTTSTAWGGTYHLIFDLNWGKKGKRTKLKTPANPETTTTPDDMEQAQQEQETEE